MRQKPLVALLCALVLCTGVSFAQSKKSSKPAAGPGPDKAYLQEIWTGWATLDPSKQSQFYAQGPHTFFDLAPLKYSNWDEYQKGATTLLADFKSARFTVNDDADTHTIGNTAWGSATVKSDLVTKSGQHDLATFRWTYIFEKQDGKWLIVHEHISEPLH